MQVADLTSESSVYLGGYFLMRDLISRVPDLEDAARAWYTAGTMLWAWVSHNWFDLLQTFAILVSFATTFYTLNRDHLTRRLTSTFEITKGHRELWLRFAEDPRLSGIFDSDSSDVSQAELLFINELILHLKTAHRASRFGMYEPPAGLSEDIVTFFSMPKPRRVWEQNRHLHDPAFREFVDSRIRPGNT